MRDVIRCSDCGKWTIKESSGMKCSECNSMNVCLYDSCESHEMCDAMKEMTKEIKWLQDQLKKKNSSE